MAPSASSTAGAVDVASDALAPQAQDMPHAARSLARSLVVLTAVLLGLPTGPAVAGSDAAGVWPLSPRPPVVRGFAPPASSYGAGHRGIDVLGSPAQPVHAALAGRVAFAGQLAGRGVVVVDHGPTRTTYEPVTPDVSAGDAVPAGGQIGLLTGALSHCAPRACLHLGWIRNADDVYLDPARLFGAAPVRLLPLEGVASPVVVSPEVVSAVRLALLAATRPWSGAGMRLLVGAT